MIPIILMLTRCFLCLADDSDDSDAGQMFPISLSDYSDAGYMVPVGHSNYSNDSNAGQMFPIILFNDATPYFKLQSTDIISQERCTLLKI